MKPQSKDEALAQLISQHGPSAEIRATAQYCLDKFQEDTTTQMYLKALNLPFLVELAMVHRSEGLYELRPDDAHADFTDGTDSKTASIRANPRKEGSVSHEGEISGVSAASGNLKAGGLRAVIWNPCQNELLYWYLPHKAWTSIVTLHPTTGIGKVKFSYNSDKDVIQRFENCIQFAKFEDLAKYKETTRGRKTRLS